MEDDGSLYLATSNGFSKQHSDCEIHNNLRNTHEITQLHLAAGLETSITKMSSNKKVLIVMSSCSTIAVEKSNGSTDHKPTGFFLKELGQPLLRLLEAGYEPVFCSPEGYTPKMDPMSDNALWFLSFAEKNKEKELIEKMKVEKNFASPKKFRDIGEKELDEYEGIFVPGGHAPMGDLGCDRNLGRILRHFHERGKPVSSYTLAHR